MTTTPADAPRPADGAPDAANAASGDRPTAEAAALAALVRPDVDLSPTALADRAVGATAAELEQLDPNRCHWVYRDGTQCGRRLPEREPGKQGSATIYCAQRHEPGHEQEGRGRHDATNWWAEKRRRERGTVSTNEPEFEVATALRPVTGGIVWLSEQLSAYRTDVHNAGAMLLDLHGKYTGLLEAVPQLADPDAARAEVSDREKEFRELLSRARGDASEADRLRLAANKARDKALEEAREAAEAADAIAAESAEAKEAAEQAALALEQVRIEADKQVQAATESARLAGENAEEKVRQIRAQADTAVGDAKNSAAEARSDADRRVKGANSERDRLVAEARTQAERGVDAAEKRATEAIREAKERTDREIEAMRQTIEVKLTQAATEVQLAESKEAAALAREETARVTAEANLARAVNAENNAKRDTAEHALELARLKEQHKRRLSELYELLGWDENGEPINDDGPSAEGRP